MEGRVWIRNLPHPINLVVIIRSKPTGGMSKLGPKKKKNFCGDALV